MKIKKSRLQQIIREEISKAVNEAPQLFQPDNDELSQYNVAYDEETERFYDPRDDETLDKEEVKKRMDAYDNRELGGVKQGRSPGAHDTKVKSGTGYGKDNKFRVKPNED